MNLEYYPEDSLILFVLCRESGDGSPAALSNGYHSSTSTSGASSGERKNYSDEETPIQTNLAPSKFAYNIILIIIFLVTQSCLFLGKRESSFSINFIQAKSFIDNTTKQNGYQTSPSTEHISSGGHINMGHIISCLFSIMHVFINDIFVFSEKGMCSPLSLDKRSPLQVNGGQPPPQRRDKKSPDSTTQPTHSPAPPPPATPPDTTDLPDYET